MLHPRHKLSYFKAAGWEREWVDAAEQTVRDEFKQNYAGLPNGGEGGGDAISSLKKKRVRSCPFYQLTLLIFCFTRYITSSTTFLRLQHRSLPNSVTNSHVISVRTQNKSQTCLCGGLTTKPPTRASRAWLLITFRFPVRDSLTKLNFSTNTWLDTLCH